MANGWAGDGAVQEQIDSTVADAVQRVRSRLPQGESASDCDGCGEMIAAGRRAALPGVRLCVACQSERDTSQGPALGYNRRGSKDSQLR